jgi:hypothetical protein
VVVLTSRSAQRRYFRPHGTIPQDCSGAGTPNGIAPLGYTLSFQSVSVGNPHLQMHLLFWGELHFLARSREEREVV